MSSAIARPCSACRLDERAQSWIEPGLPWTKTAASVGPSGPASSVGERTPSTETSPGGSWPQGYLELLGTYTWPAMTLVVKLGSSIVAADDGELRADVLDSVCEQVASLEQGGERVVMVTSGAIARGMRLMGLPVRPRAMDELQAASAVGQGDLFRAYEQRLAPARHARRPGAADRRRHRRPHQLPQRAPDPAQADRVGGGPGRQRERHDRHRRDHLRRQRLPRRPGRDPARRPPARPAHQRRRPLQRRSARRRRGGADRRQVEDFSELDGHGDRRPHLGLRLGRDAQQGRRRRDGERGRDPGGDLQRDRRPAPSPPRPPARRSARASPRRAARRPSFKLWLKYAKPAHGRLLVDEGAARVLRESGSSLLPVGIVGVEGDFEAGDAVEVAADGTVVGKGIVDYSAGELARVIGMKSAEVRELLPHAADEVIHRDRFVLRLRPRKPAGPSAWRACYP